MVILPGNRHVVLERRLGDSRALTGDTETDEGGLVGRQTTGTTTNSFWDEDIFVATSDYGTAKTTAEMQDIATFTDTNTEGLEVSWDFDDIWAIDDSGEPINDGYPYLQVFHP